MLPRSAILLVLTCAFVTGAITGTRAEGYPARRRLLQGKGPGNNQCDFTCDCAKCAGITEPDADGMVQVTIDVTDCKAGGISWLCCKGADGTSDHSCDLADGDPCINGNTDGPTKCEESTQAIFEVADGTTSILVEYHDGQACGNTDCSTQGPCCGSANAQANCYCSNGQQATTNICRQTVSLSSCGPPVGGGGPCDGVDCSELDGPCGTAECVEGDCVVTYEPEGTPCGNPKSTDPDEPCDADDVCDGEHTYCPDTLEPDTTLCRAAPDEPTCDVDDYCTGNSKDCPDDVKPKDTVCRDAPAEPTCDVAEVCDGDSKDCPDDEFKPKDTVCRPASTSDKCDLAEVCTGTGPDCPPDARRDKAYAFKCGRDCYVCGDGASSDVKQVGNVWYFGQGSTACNMGACDAAPQPVGGDCTGCVSTTCPNNKALSNVEFAKCDPATGHYTCTQKKDAPFGTTCVSPSV